MKSQLEEVIHERSESTSDNLSSKSQNNLEGLINKEENTIESDLNGVLNSSARMLRHDQASPQIQKTNQPEGRQKKNKTLKAIAKNIEKQTNDKKFRKKILKRGVSQLTHTEVT